MLAEMYSVESANVGYPPPTRDPLRPLGLALISVLMSCSGGEPAPCASGFERRADGNCYALTAEDTAEPTGGDDTGDTSGSDSGGSDSGDDTADDTGTDEPDPELLALIEAWAAANEYIYEGMGYTAWDNRQAILSQNEDAVMEAILEIYRATGDVVWLRLFVLHGDAVLAWRDDNAGYTDYSGESNPIWSDAYELYVNGGKAYGFALESGQLGFPLADFAQIVLNDPDLQTLDAGDGRTLYTVASGYVTACEETLSYHHARWHTDTVEVDGQTHEIGWFSTRPDADFVIGIPAGGILPVNHQTSLGRMVAALAQANGSASHMDRLQRMTRWVDLELTTDDSDAYVWHYWPTMPYYADGTVDNGGNDNIEDFSHAVITTEFARASVDAGAGVWDETDLARFSRTFRENLYTGTPGVFNVLVDGTVPENRATDRYQSGRFLRVAQYDEGHAAEHYEIARYALLDDLQVHEEGMIGGATGLLSLAELIRFWELQEDD
jgi:hypothetical protein